MEKQERKINGIMLDAEDQMLCVFDAVIEKMKGMSLEEFEKNHREEAYDLGKKIAEQAAKEIYEKFKPDKYLDEFGMDHSVIIEDENFDRWICVPLFNLDEIYRKYVKEE